MPRTPKHIGESMRMLVRDLGIEAQIEKMRLLESWPELVGEKVAAVTQADRVDDGILYVKVSSMTWRTELLFQKPMILKKIGDRFGQNAIREIRFF